jgi:hypothetical protein
MMQVWILYRERELERWLEEQWYRRGDFDVELCTSCLEELMLVGITIMLSLRREINNTRSILSLERIPCIGIKDSDILEKRAFEHYMIKVWLKVHLISPWILIFVNIVYMVNIIE